MPWYRITSYDEACRESRSEQVFRSDKRAISCFEKQVREAKKNMKDNRRFQLPRQLKRIDQREVTSDITPGPADDFSDVS